MAKLDLRDRKILYELDINSRQPLYEIAHKVGLSSDSVAYRINKLQKEGVIQQFHTVVDVSKLGLRDFRLYIKLQNANREKEQEIINFLKNQGAVNWLVSIDGEYDIGLTVLSRGDDDVLKLWRDLHDKYINYLDKHWLTMLPKISYFPRVFFLGKELNTEQFTFVSGSKEVKLDNLDIEILRLLAPNSRITISEIAKKFDLAPNTVSYRINKLEQRGVILGYRTRFDLEKLGLQYYKVLFNLYNITKKKRDQFKKYIREHPNIIFDVEALGGDDIDIEIQVENFQDFRKIIDDIKDKFSDIIKDYRHMLFYKEHKWMFFPL